MLHLENCLFSRAMGYIKALFPTLLTAKYFISEMTVLDYARFPRKKR